MSQTLKNSNNLKIIVEYHPDSLKEFGHDHKKFAKLLFDDGFTLYDVGENNLEKISLDKILQKYPLGKGHGTSFLCIKE